MAGAVLIELPRRPGTAIFAGGGAWLPRTVALPRWAGAPEGLEDREDAAGEVAGDLEAPRRGPEAPRGAVTRGLDAPRHAVTDRPEAPRGAVTRGDEALILSDPCRVLLAMTAEHVPGLLDEVEAEQRRGRWVAGYLAYEAGAAFGLAVRTPAPDALPLAWMAVYPQEHAMVVSAAEWRRYLDGVDVSGVATALCGVRPELSVSRDEYVAAIAQVRDLIAAGDTYQVNYTVRGRYELRAPAQRGAEARAGVIDPLDYFLALVVRQAVPYAAYLDLGDSQVISLSPEMFLRRRGNRLESRPMKGTRPRGAIHAEDVALAYQLAEMEKERAENLMIVDMVRNDLGRVCRAGSVRVPTLYAVEPYRTVWQMVSTVTGDVNPRAGLSEIMRAVFPGASITGAPKYHTMEIIAALETEPRDVYTGALGCFYPDGDFTTNIAIRTIVHHDGRCRLGTGSGVVWDAAAGAEYEETLAKAAFATPPAADTWRPDPAALLRAEETRLFETILLEAQEGDPAGKNTLDGLSPSLRLSDAAMAARYVFLAEHLERLETSARALGFAFDREAALAILTDLARITPEAAAVRLELDAAGTVTRSTRAAPGWGTPAGPVAVLVSPFRTDPDDPFLHHKTTVRGFYDREHRRAARVGCVDALFLNRLDHVTEGAISNIAVRSGDRWMTPPLEDGVLAGIWRAHLLAATGGEECSLTLDELLAADEIILGNSVRGTVSVDRVIVDPLVF